MDPDVLGDIFGFLLVIVLAGGLLILTFISGTVVERAHYRSIRRREEQLRDILVFAVRMPPAVFADCRSEFVCGSVVVGMDHFKKTLASLRNIVGGRVGSYEALYDRARREAILRMKQEARDLDARCVLNVKFSTANILSGDKDNKGSGCVEVIAYGTALVPR